MQQKEWLAKLESKLGIEKPVFLNVSRTWEYSLNNLKRANEVTELPTIGRLRLDSELWFDVDGKKATFKELKEATLQLIETLKWFGIPEEYIIVKSSGHGFHIHVFTERIRDIAQRNQIMLAIFVKSGLPNSEKQPDKLGIDVPRLTSANQRIREFGAVNGEHHCSVVTVDDLKKMKAYPTVKDPSQVVYPEIKLFKVDNKFIRKVHEVETSVIRAPMDTGETDFELDGDVQHLYKCPLVNQLAQKAVNERHLTNTERVFVSQVFSYFGERGREEVHKILKPCKDYDHDYTQYQIEALMRSGRKPITCDWAKQNEMCPSDCQGSGGRSPIKFAWSPLTFDDLFEIMKEKGLSFETETGHEDKELFKIIKAANLDRQIKGDPLWLFIVAPSGAMKTELIRILKCNTYSLDTITKAGAISGQVIYDKKTGEYKWTGGCVDEMNGKVVVIKDFTMILSKPRETRDEIFALFRNMYDGYLEGAYGTAKTKLSKECRIGLIAGVTPIIDQYGWMLTQLGQRFVKVRHLLKEKKAMKAALESFGQEDKRRIELQKLDYRFTSNLDLSYELKLSEENIDEIMELALYTSRMRTVLLGETGETFFLNTLEYGTRLCLQFAKLLFGLVYVDQSREIKKEHMDTIARVAFDTPPLERTFITKLLYETNEPTSTAEIAKQMKVSEYKVSKILQEMYSLGILEQDVSFNWKLASTYVSFYDSWYSRGFREWSSKLVGRVLNELNKKKREHKPEAHSPQLTRPSTGGLDAYVS